MIPPRGNRLADCLGDLGQVRLQLAGDALCQFANWRTRPGLLRQFAHGRTDSGLAFPARPGLPPPPCGLNPKDPR